MSCTATFKINNIDGTSSTITLEVPNNNVSYSEIVDKLLDDDSKLSELIQAINSSKLPSNEILSDAFIEDIPLGSISIHGLASIADSRYGKTSSFLANRLLSLGESVDTTNILLTSATFRFLYNNKFGYYSKGDKELYITRDSEKNIEPFLKYRVLKAMIEKSPESLSDTFFDEIGNIMDKVDDYKNTKDKKKAARITKLKDQINGTTDFIKIYYTDSLFKNSVDEINPKMESLLNENLFGKIVYNLKENLSAEVKSHKFGRDFINLSKEAGEDSIELSLTDYSKLSYEYPTYNSIEEMLWAINNKIESQRYLELDSTTENSYILKSTELKPRIGTTLVDSEYYGDLVDNISTINGYNIVRHENKYYVTNRIVNTELQLPANSFNSEKEAREFVKKALIRTRLFNEGTIQSIVKRSSKNTFTSKASYNIGDRFSILDIPINSSINIHNNPLLKGGKSLTFTTFFKEYSAKNKELVESLRVMGDILENILDTPEKVEVFLYLETEAREVGTNLKEDVREILHKINSANTIVYEITNYNKVLSDNNYQIAIINKKNDLQEKKEDISSIQGKMNTVSEHLSKNYGIKVNILTEGDIEAQFKTIIPYASRVRAFVYNGDIYINSNRANSADKFHEFAHLAMGYIKKSNPNLYYALVDKTESLNDFGQRVHKYKQIGDTRALPDLKEEIFVTLFGDYAHSKLNEWFIDKREDLNSVSDDFKKGIQKAFQTDSFITSYEVQDLLNMSMSDIFNRFGSMLFTAESLDLVSTIETRQITNVISDLIKNNILTEKCS